MEEKSAANATHRDEACQRLSPVGRKLFKYVEYDSDEDLIAEIRKHPIGLVTTAIIGLLISLSVFAGAMLLAANLENLGFDLGDGSGSLKSLIIIFGVILSLLALGVTAISLVLYIRNVIFVTNEKIAEVAYISLFNRKVTQLGLGQVEDVTIQQQGIFSHIFDYGIITIETAGEKENCTFTLVPTPNKYSQVIIEAHEGNVHRFGN
ncbi:MAG: hypothetical protein ACXWLH_00585 [Candidatus Saccharimonadales bacterium]